LELCGRGSGEEEEEEEEEEERLYLQLETQEEEELGGALFAIGRRSVGQGIAAEGQGGYSRRYIVYWNSL
jgi:hypothetical protein